jgi:hypothetical protein
LYDSAGPCTAVDTIPTLEILNWEILDKLAYNLDLPVSDFHLCGPLKKALRSSGFTDNDKAKEVIRY